MRPVSKLLIYDTGVISYIRHPAAFATHKPWTGKGPSRACQHGVEVPLKLSGRKTGQGSRGYSTCLRRAPAQSTTKYFDFNTSNTIYLRLHSCQIRPSYYRCNSYCFNKDMLPLGTGVGASTGGALPVRRFTVSHRTGFVMQCQKDNSTKTSFIPCRNQALSKRLTLFAFG